MWTFWGDRHNSHWKKNVFKYWTFGFIQPYLNYRTFSTEKLQIYKLFISRAFKTKNKLFLSTSAACAGIGVMKSLRCQKVNSVEGINMFFRFNFQSTTNEHIPVIIINFYEGIWITKSLISTKIKMSPIRL